MTRVHCDACDAVVAPGSDAWVGSWAWSVRDRRGRFDVKARVDDGEDLAPADLCGECLAAIMRQWLEDRGARHAGRGGQR